MKPVSCQYCERAARLGLGALEGMVCGGIDGELLGVRWVRASITLR